MRTIFIFSFALLLIFAMPYRADAVRLWSSGCEFMSDAPGSIGGEAYEWDQSTGSDFVEVTTSVKRSGASACESSPSAAWGQVAKEFASVSIEPHYVRFYIRIDIAPNATLDEFASLSGTSDDVEMYLAILTDNKLRLRDDEGNTIGTSATGLELNTWYRIEWFYDSGGEASLRVDGTEVVSTGSHTGDGISKLWMGVCCSHTATMYFDDIAINDTNGAEQTSWPGEGRIVHLQPDGSAGDINEASAGSCASVDEITPDDATTIANLDANSDDIDCPVESPIAAGIDPYDSVTLVSVGARHAENPSGTGNLAYRLRVKSASGGTVTFGSAVTHNDGTYQTNGDAAPRNYSLASSTDPTTTSAWTVLGINSLDQMQIGMTATDASPDVGLSTLWALVEYVDGAAPSGLTRYNLVDQSIDANTNPISATTQMFSPPSDSLIVVSIAVSAEAIDIRDGMTVDGGGLTWTRQGGPNGANDGGTFYASHEMWTAPVATGADMQITVSHSGSCGSDCQVMISAVAYTGYNTSDPIGGTASDDTLTDGAASITLSQTPASDSVVVASRCLVPTSTTDSTATEGGGWTEIFDRSSGTGNGEGNLQTQERGSSVSTTVSWADTDDANVSQWSLSGLALEIMAAGGGGGETAQMRIRSAGARIKISGGRIILRSN